ncbi:MAG TPA: hypothetical protein ENG74_03785, partial [Thermoplasmatales archaeon]|nr:hypothetical protein [Thermoplasmatales archaeon]
MRVIKIACTTRTKTTTFVLLMLLLSILVPSLSKAEEDEAYIIATIDGDIPPIKAGKWTPINITVIDKIGFNWTYFMREYPKVAYPPGLRWIGYLQVWILWPKFRFKKFQDAFGYNTLTFIPEIVEGNPKGWKMKVEPSSVSPTTDGTKHHITLYVWADETAMDYAVTIGVKCIRCGSTGKVLGSSYIYIPVKLELYNYMEMVVDEPRKVMSPWSTSQVTATVTNKGYYEDTFHFILKEEGGIVAQANEQQIVIKP